MRAEQGCEINEVELRVYRRRIYRHLPANRVGSLEEAVDFVNLRGFIFFWPIQGVDLPSLWQAVAGDRPVASEHNDPGHRTWAWKDTLLGTQQVYYAKVLRRRATLISMQIAPYFYALSENYGSPEEDYLVQYESGRMRQSTKLVYEAILEAGPIDTVALRRAVHMTSKESNYRFGRALEELQRDFKILPVGIAEAGAWNYAYLYDLVPRFLPELPERARPIGEREARMELIRRYLESVGAAPVSQIKKVFQWEARWLRDALERMAEEGDLRRGCSLKGESGEWVTLTQQADLLKS